MLRPIPARILSDTCTVKVPAGLDIWQNVTYGETVVRKVHLQHENRVARTKDNTDVTLNATLFVDARLSAPSLDWDALMTTAEQNGGQLVVIVGDHTYKAISVDSVPDDQGKLHHVEVALV